MRVQNVSTAQMRWNDAVTTAETLAPLTPLLINYDGWNYNAVTTASALFVVVACFTVEPSAWKTSKPNKRYETADGQVDGGGMATCTPRRGAPLPPG